MNKFYTFLLVVCLALASGTAWAESISESQARSIAQGFMTSHRMQSTGLKLSKKGTALNASPSVDKAAYYVFNSASAQGGYVIVAGDDRAPAVLGYSDKGTFDAQDVPEAMQALLDSYAEQIEALKGGAKAAPSLTSGTAVAPLVHAVWSQNNPYNILLPYRPDGKHAVAGCVATAMAQVMHYWQWPVRPTQAIPAYTSQSLGYYMPELPAVDFNWSEMHNTYETTDTTSSAALAAATLTLYCAQSVEMDFKEQSSGASTMAIPWKLSTYFGYKPSAHGIKRMNYTSQEWSDIIYNELAEKRPVIFSGSKKTGGHAFICDGYDGNGLYHFNWGWNGQSNGYFLLNVVNPDAQGTGSASGTYGYILDQAALIGIEPGEGDSECILSMTDFTLNSATTSRDDTNDYFWFNVTGRFHNLTSEVLAVRYGWGLYQDDELIETLSISYSSSLRPNYFSTLSNKYLMFGPGMTSGTYRILPICTRYGTEDWHLCDGDKNYIEVTIDGNTCQYTCYGSAAERDYTINDIIFEGFKHNGRPVDVGVNMTNNGESINNILYMFADGAFVGAAQVTLLKGETGYTVFNYMPMTAGDHQLSWSWNDNGSNPIASRTITIDSMPAANLSGTMQVLNVTDNANYVITSNKFGIDLIVTNNGETLYMEDISVSLFKQTHDNYATDVQSINQPINLAPGETMTLHFELDPVVDNWQYFARAYYYSEGTQKRLVSSSFYTLVFPEEPQVMLGDVNGDNTISIRDVTLLINYLLSKDETGIIIGNADMDGNGNINITDVTRLINKLLSSGN